MIGSGQNEWNNRDGLQNPNTIKKVTIRRFFKTVCWNEMTYGHGFKRDTEPLKCQIWSWLNGLFLLLRIAAFALKPLLFNLYYSHLMEIPTKWSLHSAKTQISLGICPVWSESSLSAWRKIGFLAIQWVHSEDADQTGRMPRLIWVFAGHKGDLFGFVVQRLIYCSSLCYRLVLTTGKIYIMLASWFCHQSSVVLLHQVGYFFEVWPVYFAVKRERYRKVLSFRTDRSWQTVQTQIRLLLKEQSDQGLHRLQFHLHPLDAFLYGKATLLKFSGDYCKYFWCPNF